MLCVNTKSSGDLARQKCVFSLCREILDIRHCGINRNMRINNYGIAIIKYNIWFYTVVIIITFYFAYFGYNQIYIYSIQLVP